MEETSEGEQGKARHVSVETSAGGEVTGGMERRHWYDAIVYLCALSFVLSSTHEWSGGQSRKYTNGIGGREKAGGMAGGETYHTTANVKILREVSA